ncbi:T-cell surface glycoprotein CD3 delta chain-like isoform X2 [Hemitrygon akajei]|uniref:T-cell surface glycoprotein CD3 delta chain-like isoform X2 n=1 Tax=Hemitrygon akajei TaxID=2704970 RepID=UPI003BF9E7E2
MQFSKILVFIVFIVFLLFGNSDGTVVIKEQSSGITLQCPNAGEWEKDGRKMDSGIVKLTRLSDTDTGEYTCIDGQQRSSTFVFVKLCKNCVQLDPSTISGIVIGDLIATIFIAVAIYCVVSSNKASGNRSFIPHNNDLYQELANRRGSSEYSQLTPRLKI